MDYINGDLDEMPDDSIGFYDPEKFRAIPPREETGLFGDLFAPDEEDPQEESNKDKYRDDPRVDCMGTPFWMDQADPSCPYAAAGWATRPLREGDPRHHITECSIWIPYGEDNSDYIRDLGLRTASHYRELYDLWSQRVMDMYRERKVEKTFPPASLS